MSMFSHESECTADVGVMGHLGCTTPGCSCRSYAYTKDEADHTPVSPFSVGYGSQVCREVVHVEPDIKLKYEFIVHQTDKAILFALKGEHGVYQQWIPRSVITAQTDKKVSVKSWFARRFV